MPEEVKSRLDDLISVAPWRSLDLTGQRVETEPFFQQLAEGEKGRIRECIFG